MRLLFIGGTGNISSECADLAYRRGHDIYVLSRGRSMVPAQYKAVQADRRDIAGMRAALEGIQPDVVLNFLGYDVAEVQIDYQLFVGKLRQYVFISSASVYAKPASLPITEESPLGNAWWDYAQKKLVCEQWLLERHRDDAFPVTIVRPSHTYSKLWVPNPASSASYTYAARLEHRKPVYVPDDGQNPWTLTAASDFAVGLVGLLGRADTIGEAFHITSDEVLTWRQIAAEIADAVGAVSPDIVNIPTDFICEVAPHMTGTLKGDKVHPGVFDNAKIKRFVPELTCQKPFRVGVRESVAWLRAHPDRQNLSAMVDHMIDEVVVRWRAVKR
ncbi:MAG TPA: NAD-dependent epimerase/dehydratase family protein [Verrucomicrobiae bacterium]